MRGDAPPDLALAIGLGGEGWHGELLLGQAPSCSASLGACTPVPGPPQTCLPAYLASFAAFGN